jgi:hypothetical protein
MKNPPDSAHKSPTRIILLVALFQVACGCESLTGNQPLFSSPEYDHEAQAESHRSRFLKDREPADMNWLLANVVRSGMSRGEISQTLGEDGKRVRDDARFKRNGGHYRENDTIWKWGPDNKGQSIFLAFRDGKLVNFDPDEFSETEDETSFP